MALFHLNSLSPLRGIRISTIDEQPTPPPLLGIGIYTSPGGTTVSSLGREPQDAREQRQLSPGGATQTASVSALSPLRGLRVHLPIFLGLTPQATHCRRFAAKLCRYQCPKAGRGISHCEDQGELPFPLPDGSLDWWHATGRDCMGSRLRSTTGR